MKRKILIVLSVLIIVSLSIVSVGCSDLNIGKIIKTDAVNKDFYGKEILQLRNAKIISYDNYGNVVAAKEYESDTYYALYNIIDNNMIVDFTVKEIKQAFAGVYKVLDYQGYNSKIYTAQGYVFDVENSNIFSSYINYSGQIYVYDKDKKNLTEINNDLAPMYEPNETVYRYSGGYIQRKGNIFYIFDKNYLFVKSVNFNEYNTSMIEKLKYFVLNNGNIICQTIELLPLDAKKYDYIQDGDKYNLHTYLANAKTGKIKLKKFDYIIYSLEKAASSEYNFAMENLVNCNQIKNNQIVESSNLLFIDNKLNIKVDINKTLINAKYIKYVADDKVLIRNDYSGKIINRKGKILYELGNISQIQFLYGMGMLKNNIIYDFNGKSVYDYNRFDRVMVYNNGIVLYDGDNTIMHTADRNGVLNEYNIISYNSRIDSGFYAMGFNEDFLSLYNLNSGTMILAGLTYDRIEFNQLNKNCFVAVVDGKCYSMIR